MSKVLDLIDKLEYTQKEKQLFIAPYIGGDLVSVQINGIRLNLSVEKDTPYGWHLFRQANKKAIAVREADELEILDYCAAIPNKYNFILIKRLNDTCWLGFPQNAGVFSKSFEVKPTPIQLISSSTQLNEVSAIYVGRWLFVEDNPKEFRAITSIKEQLRSATAPENLSVKGLTPEQKTVYEILYSELEEATPFKRDQKRAKAIIEKLGGKMGDMKQNYGDRWTISWRDSRGAPVITTVEAGSLRGNSAGYCLDGGDRRIDLQTIVALKENRYKVQGY